MECSPLSFNSPACFFITVFVPAIFDLYPLNLTTGVVSITDGFKISELVWFFSGYSLWSNDCHKGYRAVILWLRMITVRIFLSPFI